MPQIKRRANLFLILTVAAIFLLTVALILLLTRPVRASTPDSGLPAGITCEMVREKVAEHGRAVALAWAIRQGYSWTEIKEAKKCLKQ